MTVLTQERKRSLRVLAAVAGVLLAVGCGGSSYGTSPSPNPANPSPGSGAADVTITIVGMAGSNSFSPNPAAVKVGQTVSWRNADSIAHDPTGSGFNTGAIASGATSAPITFSAAGSIDYHCGIHPTMVGTLSVTQ
jgi:plastocyanin